MAVITRKNMFILILLFVCVIFVHIVLDIRTIFHDSSLTPIYIKFEENLTEESATTIGNFESRLIINTTGCQIPRTPLFPKYFKENWNLVQIPDCSYEKILSILREDQIILLSPEVLENSNSKCCLHEISRPKNEDRGYRLSPCQNLTTFLDVSQKEMLLTKCGNSLNFEVNIPIKPKVRKKLDFWRNISREELPPSILLFGFDTVSRSHAYRSLPESLSLLKQMGFVDFKGFHSLAPETIPNYLGFLMGLTRDEVRNGCAPSWTSPFDSCPFIWKEFSEQKYVTMYMEDGSQTFNWGGQAGFHQKPTDFYHHALFGAIKDLRNKYSPIDGDDDKLDCTSTETVPQFSIRYSGRFVRKFQDVPFFSFTWLEDPFHDNPFTLGKLDQEIKGFFDIFNEIPELLERTLIILLSDHGDRYSFFQTKSMEGFVERGLPPFFIRVPEILKKKFPDLERMLERSSEAMTSPFDLHHTFKHILSIYEKTHTSDGAEVTIQDFEPVLEDRVSLLVGAADFNRTCEKLHVQPGCCVCGTSLEVESIQNPFYLTQIMDFAQNKLNQIVSASKYKEVCEEWEATVDSILSSRILKKTENYTDTLIQFIADPGQAQFEVKIKVFHSVSNFDGCELMGEFGRVNSYGDQSSCVDFKTDEDKKMKELCMCK